MEIGKLLGGSHVECDECHLENDPLLDREPVKLFEQGLRAGVPSCLEHDSRMITLHAL